MGKIVYGSRQNIKGLKVNLVAVFGLFLFTTIFFGIFLKYQNSLAKSILTFFLISYLFVITAWRNYSIGTDTMNYVSLFGSLGAPTTQINFFDFIEMIHARFEYGFIILNKLVYHFSQNPRYLLIASSLIIYVSLYIFIRSLSKDPYLSITMFVSLGYMASSMNTMRQSVAISFVMLAYVSIIKYRNYFFGFLNIFCGFLFHKTALIFLIIVLLKNWKYSKKNVFFLLVGSIFVSFLYGKFSGVINQINYTDYSNSGITSGYLGIVVNILVILIFIVVGNIAKKKVYSSSDNYDNSILQLLIIIAIGVYLVSFNFSQLTRIAMYFQLAMMIYVPNVISSVKDNKLKIYLYLFSYSILVSYFFVVLVVRPNWSNITPYLFG